MGEPDRVDGAGEPGSTRLAAIAGVVVFLYALWWAGSLAVAAFSPASFNGLQRGYRSIGVRAALAVVALAAVHHLTHGIARLVSAEAPGTERAARARTAATFLTGALGLPVALVVLWPAVSSSLS